MNRICAILWLFGLAAMLAAGAPSAAYAHAGHSHHANAHQHALAHSELAQKQVAPDQVAQVRPKQAEASARSLHLAPNAPETDQACDNRGCCFSGHCASGVTAIAPNSGAAWPPARSAVYDVFMSLVVADAPAGRLRRPPRFLS